MAAHKKWLTPAAISILCILSCCFANCNNLQYLNLYKQTMYRKPAQLKIING
jgi:hypothetical protein